MMDRFVQVNVIGQVSVIGQVNRTFMYDRDGL